MQKTESQHNHLQGQPAQRQGGSAALESPQGEQIAQLDAVAEASPQRGRLAQLAAMANNSPGMAAQRKAISAIHNSPNMMFQRQRIDTLAGEAAQRQKAEEPLQAIVSQRDEAPAKPNNTGLPDNLKSGIESLSGMSMDNVKVHYNSSQPAQLNALAYAQGTDIHVAPGQEQHLPHEAWHVVQQAQGRVQPTMQMNEGVPVNDDAGLEHEADVMGARALQMKGRSGSRTEVSPAGQVVQREVSKDRLNVIGETHDESDARRGQERNYAKKIIGEDAGYWGEQEFALGDRTGWGDPKHLRLAEVLSRIERHFTPLEKLASNIAASNNGFTKEQLQLVRQALQVGLDTYLVRLVGEVKENLVLMKAGKNALGGQMDGKSFGALGTNAIRLKRELEARIGEADDCIRGANNPDFALDLWVTCFEIQQLGAESINEEHKGNTVITEERSLAMHDAANAAVGRKGIWKIGQEHVGDIGMVTDSGGRNYELIDKKTFNYYLAFPTPSEAKKLGYYDKKKK